MALKVTVLTLLLVIHMTSSTTKHGHGGYFHRPWLYGYGPGIYGPGIYSPGIYGPYGPYGPYGYGGYGSGYRPPGDGANVPIGYGGFRPPFWGLGLFGGPGIFSGLFRGRGFQEGSIEMSGKSESPNNGYKYVPNGGYGYGSYTPGDDESEYEKYQNFEWS